MFSQVSNDEWNLLFKCIPNMFVIRIAIGFIAPIASIGVAITTTLCFLYDKNFGMIVCNIWKELIKFPPQITLKLEVRHFSKFVIFKRNVKTFRKRNENMKLMKLNNRNDYYFRVYMCATTVYFCWHQILIGFVIFVWASMTMKVKNRIYIYFFSLLIQQQTNLFPFNG